MGTAISVEQGKESSKTVIVFDWDDTLLCTSAIRKSECSLYQLGVLESKVQAVLSIAKSLGDVVIVTNGQQDWVQESAKLFMPQLVPMLEGMTIVSARALYEDEYPDDPVMWKCAAFKQLVTGRDATGLNLVALGDQVPELHAACLIGDTMGDAMVKIVKMSEGPSIMELAGQLCRLECELSSIVDAEVSTGYKIISQQSSGGSGCFVSRASSWACTAVGSPSHLLDTLTFLETPTGNAVLA